MVSLILYCISAVLFVIGIRQQKRNGGKEKLGRDIKAGLDEMTARRRRKLYGRPKYDQWDAFFDVVSIVEDDD